MTNLCPYLHVSYKHQELNEFIFKVIVDIDTTYMGIFILNQNHIDVITIHLSVLWVTNTSVTQHLTTVSHLMGSGTVS